MITCLLKCQSKTLDFPLSKVVWRSNSSSQILSDYRVFQDQAEFLHSNQHYRSVITGRVAPEEYQNSIQARDLAMARAWAHRTVLVYALGVDPQRVTCQNHQLTWAAGNYLTGHDAETWAEFVRIR